MLVFDCRNLLEINCRKMLENTCCLQAYIKHKIRVAGGSENILSDDALITLANYSKGNPRVADNVMSTALKVGAQLKKDMIDSEVILEAINEQTLG